MTARSLPGHASVVVIGGGVMGCSTLYHLATSGVSDAVLLERDKLTSGTTWHSAAQVRALRSSRALTDLVRYSISLYSSLEAETGQATGWINKGSVSIATSNERLTHIRRQAALAGLFGLEALPVSAGEARERWPLMNAEDVIGAVWSPGDGRVSPSDLCAALVKGARAGGAAIFEDTAVTGILTSGGRVRGLETTHGAIRCDAVAICAGLWSRACAAMGGASAPLWPCEHFYLLTRSVPGLHGNLPTLSDHDSHLYIRDDSGGLLVGCFEPHARAIDPASLGEDFAFQLLPEDWDHFEPMMLNALHRVPALESAQVKMLLNGPESFTPDGSFLLGESAETRGLYLGCGMNSVGVATGGGAGMALAHCILHGRTPADLQQADPARFPDCFNSARALAARAPEVLGNHYAIDYPNHQWTSARDLRLTPLHDEWREAHAHFGQFNGYERPLCFDMQETPALTFGRPAWFEQVGKEVAQAHAAAAVFDLSTLGKIAVEGPDAQCYLNRVCANDMRRAPGSVIYTAMLSEWGGFVSDLTVLRIDDGHYLLYVATGSIKRDMAWLSRHTQTTDRVTLTDVSARRAVLGLAGPAAASVVRAAGAAELDQLAYYRHREITMAGVPVRAVRLSYVGEAGWELSCAAADARPLYAALVAAGARPAGLLAQSSMRIEKRFLAFGHDLDGDLTPLDVGLEFAVGWDTEFIGRDALLERREQGAKNRVLAIVLDEADAVPIGNEPVLLNGAVVGRTTSAAFGYRIGRPVVLALLHNAVSAELEGAQLTLDIAGRAYTGRAGARAPFDPEGRRMR